MENQHDGKVYVKGRGWVAEKACQHCRCVIVPTDGHYARRKFCSRECQIADQNSKKMKILGWPTLIGREDIPSSTTGAIGELIAAAELCAQGFSVFRSVSPSAPYDLIATTNDHMITVEVRRGSPSRKEESTSFNFCRNRKDKGISPADYFAVILHQVIQFVPNTPEYAGPQLIREEWRLLPKITASTNTTNHQ